MNTRKKEVMKVTSSVYKLTQQFSSARVEAEQLEDGDPRNKELTDKMEVLAMGVMNHLLLNELRVISEAD